MKTNDVCLLAFSLPMAIRGLKMAPRGPKRAQDGFQDRSRKPNMAPHLLSLHSRVLMLRLATKKIRKDGPRSAQERSKSVSRGAQEAILEALEGQS